MFIVCKPHTASLRDHASVVSALVHTGRRLDFKVRCRLFDFVLNYALSYAQIYEFLMMWTRHRFVGIRYDFQHSCNEWRCAHGFPIIMIRICNAMTLEDIGLTSVIRKDNNTFRDHKKLCACFSTVRSWSSNRLAWYRNAGIVATFVFATRQHHSTTGSWLVSTLTSSYTGLTKTCILKMSVKHVEIRELCI